MNAPTPPPVTPTVGIARRFRLSAAQRALWFAQQTAMDVPINVAQYVEIDGPIDIDLFLRVTGDVVRRAQFLQVRFEDTDDGLVGVYDPSLHYWADVIDLRDRPDPRAAAEAIMREDCARPLDPRVDRTARGCLFRLAEKKFIVYNRGHHLLTDGMGGKDRMVEAIAAYHAAVTGGTPPPAKPVDLDLPARADDEYRASRRFDTDRAYWRQSMAGVGIPATLAHRRGRPEALSRRVAAPLDTETMDLLRRAAEANSTILPNVIVGAFSAYLCRAAAEGDEVIFQFPVAARTIAALRSTPLPVANIVPLRTGVAGHGSVAEALSGSQAALLGALRHQRYRGEDIWADVAADETSGRVRRAAAQERSGPMLNLMLFQREFPCGEAHGTFHILTVGPAEDLAVNIVPVAGEDRDSVLMIGVEANPNRYDEAEVAEHHRQFVAMLRTFADALLHAPDTRVDDLPLANPMTVVRGAIPEPGPATVPEALASAAARHGHSPVFDEPRTRPLTFGQLHVRATDLADRLRTVGVVPGSTVALALPPGVDRLTAWWAIGVSGAAVLLLDPLAPRAAVASLPEATRPEVVIAARSEDAPASESAPRVLTLAELGGLEASGAAARRPAPNDIAAYLAITGATSELTTLAVPQRALAALIATGVFDAAATDLEHGRLFFGAPSASSAAHLEIIAAAAHGLRLVVPGADAVPATHVIATPGDVPRLSVQGPVTSLVVVGEDIAPAALVRLAFGREVSAPYCPRGAFGPVTVNRRIARDAAVDHRLPSGTPRPGAGLAVLDPSLRPVPAGVTGDVYVTGPQVATVIAGDPVHTACTFVACPWERGARMLHTGDRGHFDPGTGSLVIDHHEYDVVTLDGVRIDLAALDRAAGQVAGVGYAVSVVAAGGLDVGVVCDSDEVDRQRVRAAVRRRVDDEVPASTRPRRVVVLDELPTDVTGNLDRRAAAESIAAAPEAQTAYRPPSTATEVAVAEAVTEVLGVPRPSMDDELVRLGATSLGFMQLATHLGSTLRVVVNMRDLASVTTLAELAAVIEAAVPRRTTSTDGVVAYRPTRAQQEIWLLNRADPHATVYHLPVRLTLAEQISADAVRMALIDVATRHEALRTVYPEVDGEPVAQVRDQDESAAAAPVTSATLDASGVDHAVSAPFDLRTEVPWRAVLDETGDAVELVLVAHHIAVDEWSLHIVLEDFAHAVRARAAGAGPVWETEAVSFSAVLDARAAGSTTASTPAAEVFWTRFRRDAPDRLALPEPAASTAAGSGLTAGPAVHTCRRIGRAVTDAAAAQARECGTTVNTLLCVALSATLGEFTDSDDVVMSMPVSGRFTSEELRPVGMFVETVPVRVTGARETSVADALAVVGGDLGTAVALADAAPTGLSDVIFAYHATAPDLVASAVFTDGATLRTRDARTALEFTLIDDGDGLSVTLTIAENRVDVPVAARLLDRFVEAVAALAAAAPDQTVAECLSPGPVTEPGSSRTAGVAPVGVDPIRALLRHAVTHPEATAVIVGDETLDYRGLVDRARALATRLVSFGVRPGDRVALLMDRRADTVVAIVATLLADAVYVPIDPDHPQARIDLILAGTAPAAVIDSRLEVTEGLGRQRAQPMPGAAYVIHTSGSTGLPKAVVVTRQNVAALLGAGLDLVEASSRDVWAWVHSYAFDFSVWEILGALASGGSVVVVDRATVRDPRALAETIVRHGITILSQTPTAFSGIVDLATTPAPPELPSLRAVVFGGETLAPKTLRAWAAEHPGTRLVNMYGITETTVVLTATDVDLDDERSIIGTPFDGVGWMVLDRRLRPVPTGAAGELYLVGEQVALGYLNALGLTATRFVADPSGTGRRMYRTGDRVREVAPGRLAYLGRNDDQVQIRGHRVELGEIVSTLRGIPGIGDARVLVRPGRRAGDEQLLAFVTEDGLADFDVLDDLDEASILAGCAARLPGHAVPSRVAIVDGWPMTSTGKIDRDKLFAAIGDAAPPVGRALGPVEETVASAIRAVVGEDAGHLGADTNFFAAGGTSLSAARLAATLAGMGHRVEVADIFEYPTVAELAARLATPGTSTAPPRVSLLSDDREIPGDLPLTPEQMDVWLRWRTEPEFTGYLLPLALPIDATPGDLRRALAAIVTRHDALCTGFPMRGGVPVQHRWDDADVLDHLERQLGPDAPEVSAWDASVSEPSVSDISGPDISGPDATTVLASMATPIDLASALPWRVRIVRIDGATWLLGVIHHIAADGESFAILAGELDTALAGATLPTSGTDYRRYSVWRDETLESRRAELTAFWRDAFARPVEQLRLPEVNLQAETVAPAAETIVHRAHAHLDATVTASLEALTVARASTPFIAAHTALAAVLARQSGARMVTIGTALSGRLDPGLVGVPGLFARAVPLHTPIDPELTFVELLSRVTTVDLGAFAHADLPLTEISEIADPGRAGAGTPLFEVSFGAVPDAIVEWVEAEFPTGSADSAAAGVLGIPLFGIDVSMYRHGGALHLTMSCTDSVATAGRLEALCELVVETLRRGVLAPDEPVVSLMSADGEDATRPEFEPEAFDALLTSYGSASPSDIAIVDSRHRIPGFGAEITEADFDRLSTHLARLLVEQGVGAGDVVVELLPRSAFGMVATAAIARAGAAFVNIDPADPVERRNLILGRCRPSVVLTLSGTDTAGIGTAVVALDDLFAELPAVVPPFADTERMRAVTPDDVAYVTFTSGTTGVPKGVAVTHRGLAGWARDTVSRLRLSAADRVMHTYATGFDAHLMGVLPPRIAGATVVMCPPDVIAADELADLVQDAGVTVLLTTPSVLATLRPGDLPHVRHVAVGGEPLGAGLIREWTRGGTLSNEYGPTEATVAVSSARYTDPVLGAVHIGRPLDGVTMHVLDPMLRPVPDHTVGELYLSGNCLARGYLDDPRTTAAAFVAGRSGTRMYRTGDLVHRRGDGTFVIHGRTDDQVKIRGVRLEPAEIDAALSRLPGVATSVTAARATAAGEKVLVSWVVGEPDAVLRTDDLASRLAHVLPRTMIPGSFIEVEELPIGRNGKIDVASLPAPDFGAAGAVTARRALSGETELLIASVWAEVLDRPADSFDADSDFFADGGTSLSATQVTSRLSTSAGVDVAARLLFETRTIGELARSVDALASQSSDTVAALLPTPARLPVPDPLPLAYPQRRMWIHHHFDPTSTAYHVPVVMRIRGRVDVARLRKAVDEVVGAHAVLRTVYPDSPTGPVQRQIEHRSPVLAHRLVEVGDDDIGTVLRQQVTEYLRAPFDLENEPGFRATVFEADTSEDTTADAPELYLAAVLHHIAIDGWSIRVLLADLMRAYEGERLAVAAYEAFTYADFAQWQMARLGDPSDRESLYARQISYWTATLADVPEPLRLPGHREHDATAGTGRITASVPALAIHQTARTLSATVFQVAHAALSATLGQLTGHWDMVIGVPVHGRSAPEWEPVVGMFVNTVALRTRLRPDTPVRDAVEQVRDVALAALAHSDVPYEDVVRAVRPAARNGDDPLISVLLVSQDVVPEASGEIALGGAVASLITEATATVDAKYDIEVVLAESDGELQVTLVHSGQIPDGVAHALLDEYTAVLRGVGEVGKPFPLVAVTAGPDGVAVAAPDHGIAESGDRTVELDDPAPGTADLVSRVGTIMAELLEVPEGSVAESADFFALGGTSLSATRVTSALGRHLGIRVPTRLLFEHPTPAALAAAVSALADADPNHPVDAAEETFDPADALSEEIPLAPTQRRMWVGAQMLGQVPIYSVPVVVGIPAGVTSAAVTAALDALVDRHTALRTRYLATPDGPRQRVVDGWRPLVRHLNASALTGTAIADEFSEPFDLAGDPPVRVWLLSERSVGDAETPSVGDAPLAVVLVAHHIAMDGESAAIVERELTALLTGEALDRQPAGFDVLARRMVAEERNSRAELMHYWREALDGYSGELDLAEHRPSTRDLRTSVIEFAVDDALAQSISSTARRAQASDFHLLHAATALALAAQTGVDDIAVATPASMRRDGDSAGTVGMLISTVVLRTRLTAGMTVGGFIETVRDADLAALDHAAIAFDDVVALVDPPRVPGRHPLVQVAFSVVEATGVGPGPAGLPSAPGADAPPDPRADAPRTAMDSHSEFDVHIVAVRSGNSWRLQLHHARDLFDDSVIRGLGERLMAAVAAVTGDPARRLAAIEPLTAAEREFVSRRARVPAPTGTEPLLADLFAEAVASHGDRPAIADGTRTLTHLEFDAWVSETARALRARGLGAGDAVAVVVPRSIESVVAIWAVSRIGGVCVPVDVTYPAARIDHVVAGAHATAIGRGDIPEQPTGPVASEPITRVSPDSLAYVITTSGTTGTPNVVGVTHRGVHRVAALGDVQSGDRVGMAISPGFDATFHDMLLPLASGATLVVVPPEVVGGRELAEFLDRTRVSVFTATPSVMRTMRPESITALRLVYIGGEALPADLAAAWSERAQVLNIYGPTETTVTVSTSAYRPGEPVRLGHPRPGIGAEVLDTRLRHVPPGVVGELYVSGTGVARGYLGDRALTAATFVAGNDGRRRYRTGDLVRWDRETGELIYVGRADRQMKIRGQRVEPAEIDAVLVGAGARRSVTVLRPGPAGPALVSYVVSSVPADRLADTCRALLPRHMVPSRIVEMAELPLSGAGKLDQRRLPEPVWSESTREPETPTESTVRDAFRAVLDEHGVGMDDDFFGMGGNSLALVQLRDELTRRTGITVDVADLFTHRTPAEVARVVGAVSSGGGTGVDQRVVPLSRVGAPAPDAPDPAAPGSHGPLVWCVHTATGIVEPFRAFGASLDSAVAYGLQLPELVVADRAMPATLPEIAALHVAAVRSRQPAGPYHLVGWSLGGVIAHEMARQLVAAGEQVAVLMVLDSRTPDDLQGVTDDELLGADHPLRAVAERHDPQAVRRFEDRSRTLAAALRSYELGPVPVGKVIYVAAEDNPDIQSWGRAVRHDAGTAVPEVDVMPAGVTHAQLGDPDVMRRLARRIEEEW
ncbi:MULTISPECIES: non-ribosomal peptide synthetase [Gordonia]|uniref:non-ribosomal peptide synthetase n=1 Tax=Gordonia TaxID=2053 RepID=UPI0004015B70|nr:non-ribosomal peptide synthetase [Gordonia sp. 1D]ATD69728.1 non-ribosomal peptide synthetase [Gordonia sp. 1D]MDV7078192.1 non-ribosomal peptide synthetase [Gordonia amicalis]